MTRSSGKTSRTGRDLSHDPTSVRSWGADRHPAQPERQLWIAVVARAIDDARLGRDLGGVRRFVTSWFGEVLDPSGIQVDRDRARQQILDLVDASEQFARERQERRNARQRERRAGDLC